MRVDQIQPQMAFQPQRAAQSAAPEQGPADSVQLSSGFDLQSVLGASRAEAASLEPKLQDYVPGEVLVKLKAGTSLQAISGFATDYGAKVIHKFNVPAVMAKEFNGELVQLTLPEGMTTAEAVAAMGRDARVSYAEPNFKVQAFGNPGVQIPDDLVEEQWGLRNTGQSGGIAGVDIKAADAWNISTGIKENGPIIAVIDTGVNYNHTDLVNNMWVNPGEVPGDGIDNDGNGIVDDVHGGNFITNTGDPLDDHNHGSHCAGVIGAEAGNGGMVGINWNAQIMGLKFLGEGGGGTTADAVKAVLYASEKGARIVNNSWGGGQFSQACLDAMAASPSLHICAAGNNGYDNDTRPSYPANYKLDNLISVAAHNNKDELAGFSNRGNKSVHLAAPGVNIHSTLKDGSYGLMSGTSMATPHVTGVAGLIASAYPEADNDAIKSRILSGVDQMPERWARRLMTGGRLNAMKALEDDKVAPAAPGTLQASATANAVTLSWTATGDDGNQGKATRYELRYARSPIAAHADNPKPGEISFDEATAVRIDAPKDAGANESVTLEMTPSGRERKLYFALRVVDNVGNRSETAVQEVRVPASKVAFEDSVDASSPFTPSGPWARIEVPGRGEVWTDSPGGEYGPKRDDAITSGSISLKDWTNPVLHFEAKMDTEKGYDGCEVEVYGKKFWGGRKWRSLETLEGIQDWKNFQLDLSDYQGQEIQLRFRFHSDDSRHRDGVWLDNIVITGNKTEGEAPKSGCF